MVGVIIGILLAVVSITVMILHSKKKLWFQKGQKMPIEKPVREKQRPSDIEFAGQTLDQKRKSIKQMSKIVEADESSEIDDYKKYKHGKDNMISNTNVLQSMADH